MRFLRVMLPYQFHTECTLFLYGVRKRSLRSFRFGLPSHEKRKLRRLRFRTP